MKLGFTGTRKGMTESQRQFLIRFLQEQKFEEVHHGACVGSDTQLHNAALMFPENVLKIVIHPPENDALKATFTPRVCDVILPPKPYLVRNKDIVNATGVLLVMPECEYSWANSKLRSGTWSTFRYAGKQHKNIIVCSPSGMVTGFTTLPDLNPMERKYTPPSEVAEDEMRNGGAE